jgi:hypothetical protein
MPEPKNKDKKIKVVATVKNPSRFYVEVGGKVKIKNMEGQVVDEFVLQAAGKSVKGKALVYPEGMRDFFGLIQQSLAPGRYIAEAVLDYGYRFRKIRAQATFVVTGKMALEQKKSLGLAITPEVLELQLKPAQLVEETIRVKNLDFRPILVKISVESFPKIRWLKVLARELYIKGKGERKLAFLIRAPEEGEYIGRIIFLSGKGEKKIVKVHIIVSGRVLKAMKEGGKK